MLGSLWERGKLKLAVDSATSTADEPTPSKPARGNRSRAAGGQPPSTACPAGPAPALPCSLLLAVYVLDELVQELGAGDSRAGVDAVCARLAHRSPVVKQKVGWAPFMRSVGWLKAGMSAASISTNRQLM